MQVSECVSCRKPKANLQCEVCEEALCKKCAQILDRKTFSFLKEIPEILSHSTYCGACYDFKVAPELETYEETMKQAKEAFVFFKTQKREPYVLKKAKEAYRIAECLDRDETILRLAFFAVNEGYNAIIETEVTAEKIRTGAYQTSNWRGTGIGALVDAEKLNRLINDEW